METLDRIDWASVNWLYVAVLMALASIVEKEARLPEERPVIAAVYLNRLRDRIPLQADPTVQYALGKHVARVYYKDLELDSPYNTYRFRGLPPGPIANPGLSSLKAALVPADADYLYFASRNDGSHRFSRTLEEHNRAVVLLRKSEAEAESEARAEAKARRWHIEVDTVLLATFVTYRKEPSGVEATATGPPTGWASNAPISIASPYERK